MKETIDEKKVNDNVEILREKIGDQLFDWSKDAQLEHHLTKAIVFMTLLGLTSELMVRDSKDLKEYKRSLRFLQEHLKCFSKDLMDFKMKDKEEK